MLDHAPSVHDTTVNSSSVDFAFLFFGCSMLLAVSTILSKSI